MDETPVSALSKDERLWGMLAHLSALSGYFIPFGHLIGPIVIWVIKKDQSAFVDAQGKESINCQITYTIYAAIAVALCFLFIGVLILPVILLTDIILVIIAGIKANEGVHFHYPVIFRFIK